MDALPGHEMIAHTQRGAERQVCAICCTVDRAIFTHRHADWPCPSVRLAAMTERATRLERVVRASWGIIHEGLHGGRATDYEDQELCTRPACREARSALSSEQPA